MMENHRKHALGHRAFLLFLSRRVKFVIFLFVLTCAGWYSERWLASWPQVAYWVDYAVGILALLSLAYFLAVLFYTYLEYRCYNYLFTPEAFVVHQGYIVRKEVATLYHQIQNVNIERGPFDRLFGVSTIVIILSGTHHDPAHNTITLPGLGKTKARLVQKELLTRARQHASGGGNTGRSLPEG
jgi:membrane protein YdbS with pleckstrin-like domain